jgi:uncharacterized protein YkwD
MGRYVIASCLLVASLAAAQDKKSDEKKVEPKLVLSAEEQQVLDLTNKERTKLKLPLLKPNPVLFKIARAHSANMAKQEKMEHKLDNKDTFQRTKEGGYKYEVCGENVGEGKDAPREKHTVEQMINWWMDSPEHRKNIVLDEFTEIGIGAVKGKNGHTYYTQLFAAPFKE